MIVRLLVEGKLFFHCKFCGSALFFLLTSLIKFMHQIILIYFLLHSVMLSIDVVMIVMIPSNTRKRNTIALPWPLWKLVQRNKNNCLEIFVLAGKVPTIVV